MELGLTEEQEMLKTSARDFLEKECPKQLVRQLDESDKGYSPGTMAKDGRTRLDGAGIS